MKSKRVSMQAAVTDTKHPDLYEWWTTTPGDEKSEIVRVAVRRYLRESTMLTTISKQLDRIERLGEEILERIGE
jgi:hypothetical protein